MAKTLSFYRIGSDNTPDIYLDGAIYFDEVNHVIKVGNGDANPDVFSGVQSASYVNKVLTLVDASGSSVVVDLNGLETAVTNAINNAISSIWDVLGSTAESGIRKQVSDLESQVESLETSVEAVEGDIETLQSDVESLEAEISEFEVPVDGIAEGDKIVSLNGKKLSSTLKISYDSTEKKIKLLGIGDEQIGDAVDCSDFVADGILESAEIVDLSEGNDEGKEPGKYFKFTWNAASGKSPVYVSMSEFSVSVYSAGKDLDMDANGKFDIALDQDIEITGVKVGNLGVDVTKLTAGMSLSEILTAMLCKDIDVKVNASPSLANISGIPASEYEVGDTVPAFTLSTSFNDGNFASSDTTLYSGAKFASNNGSNPLAAGCTVGNYTWTGVDESSENTATVESFEITSKKTYSVVASFSASTATPKTLLGNDSAINIKAGNTSSKSASINVYYKDFYGVIPASNTNVSADDGLTSVEDLTLSGVKHSTSSFTITVNPGDKGVYIWTKSTVKSFMNGSDNFTADLKKAVVSYTHGTQTTSYNLYSFPNVAGYAVGTSYVVTLN